MQTLDYVVLGVYFLAMAAIGVLCMLRVKRQEDFFLGGRSFGKLLQTFAAFGAGTGSNDPIQVGRTTWTSGLSGIWSVLLWLFVTPFYWIAGVWYRRMRHMTLGDWFVERYDSKAMGAGYTLFAFAFYVMYLSTMFSAITKFAIPLLGVEAVTLPGLANPIPIQFLLVPTITLVVILYGVLGGLSAAYWTDLIQGICIIILSVVLIPCGLLALVKRFGDPATMTMWDGFHIMHQRATGDYFKIFEGPRAGEFPLHYIISLALLALVGIVVQPHFIATGGGSAKNETAARIGLVTGNFMKRLCTVGWALTGLITLVLLADNVEIAQDPDRVWGVASRELLGPLNSGLVGLMFACLLAALMSSVDCYMLVTSALVVRNVYAAYFVKDADERTYVRVGRISSFIVPVGAACVSLISMDVLGQFKLALEVPILFAAPFWVGLYWRGVGKTAAWLTIAFSALFFFVIPYAAPKMVPGLTRNAAYTIANDIVVTTITRPAQQTDVAKREADRSVWQTRYDEAIKLPEPDRSAALKKLGPLPGEIAVGDEFQDIYRSGGKAIFWKDGLTPVEGSRVKEITIRSNEQGNRRVDIIRQEGEFTGQGLFKLDFILYQFVGIDLTTKTDAMLETLRLPPRLITPFVVLILLGWITPGTPRRKLDRYYAKMKTPVQSDPEIDREHLEAAFANLEQFEAKKLFPGTRLEFQRPTLVDVLGFVICFFICFLIIGLAVVLSSIGAE